MEQEIVIKDEKLYIALFLSREKTHTKPIYLIEFNLVKDSDFKFLKEVIKE